MRFIKMQGLGNDYVFVDCFHERVDDPAAVARRVSDRRFGVGSDGLILIRPGGEYDFRMEMYNADGSRAEMCGNGLRCAGKYVFEKGHASGTRLTAATDDGPRKLELTCDDGMVSAVRVDMGVPRLKRADIPMVGGDGPVLGERITIQDLDLTVSCLSMGNPHCVVFVEDVERYPVARVGPALEGHELFPNRANVEFVQVLSRNEVRQRTWERGSGETFACGTGACATVVAGCLNDLLDGDVTVHLTGGDLEIAWAGEEEPVFMTGPAVEVFRGDIEV